MIKLLTLNNLSAASSDALYKICLSLDEYNMSDEDVISFGSYDELFGAIESYVSIYGNIIVAVEPYDFLRLKHEMAGRFGLDEVSSPNIAEALSMNYELENAEFDVPSQCSVPSQSKVHLSSDGLYSGYSFEVLSGICTFVALDFSRIDSVISNYINSVLTSGAAAFDSMGDEYYDEPDTAYSFKDDVSKMIYSLINSDRRVSVVMSEATTWIYELYSEIDGLSDAINFVDVIDEEEKPKEEPAQDEETKDADEETAETEDGEEPSDTDEDEKSESEEDEKKAEPKEKESVSAKTIRLAREAKKNMNSEFGAAISEVYSGIEEDGTQSFFAFVAVADEKTTKAKKITTANESEANLLLAHCVTVLCETVCQKNEEMGPSEDEEPEEKKADEKSIPKKYIALAAAVLAVAIIVPIAVMLIIIKPAKQPADTTTTSILPAIVTTQPESTTSDPFGLNSTTSAPDASGLTRLEPTASEITKEQTSPAVSSTSGKFTFYVFGYGHGCGMSQNGANWLAKQGWNYSQILTNYYYGTTLVSGDTYPETITYNGDRKNTREFLAGVLEAEMGGSYEPEALKAQAVAAYTYAKYKKFNITDTDMAYKGSASERCYSAVDAVMRSGLYISHNGETALTPFFAISAGVTTSYKNWVGDREISYLEGGAPSYGDYEAEQFQTKVEITTDELKSIASSKPDLGISFSGDPATWITIISNDKTFKDSEGEDIGYVSSINVGGKIMTGNDFRIKFLDRKIRSHCFVVVYTPDTN